MDIHSDRSGLFAGLYRATLGPLRGYLNRILGNQAEAQDLAHDAYLRVRQAIENNEAHNPEAFLYTTARRLAFNQLRRRRISPVISTASPDTYTAAPGPGVVQQVIARQELQHLERAIAGLPEGCRTVLLLRKIELLSHREISDRLGIALSTVEKQHARALRLLRAALEPKAGEGTAAASPPAPIRLRS